MTSSVQQRVADQNTKSTLPAKGKGKQEDLGLMKTAGAYDDVAQVAPEKSVEQLLSEVRKPLVERLEKEETIGTGGMGSLA